MPAPWKPDEGDERAHSVFAEAIGRAEELRTRSQAAIDDLGLLEQFFAGAERQVLAERRRADAVWRLIFLMAPELVGSAGVQGLEHKLIGLTREVSRNDADLQSWMKDCIDQLIEDLEIDEP